MTRYFVEEDWLDSAAQDTYLPDDLADYLYEDDHFQSEPELLPDVIEMIPQPGGQRMMVLLTVVGVFLLFLVGAVLEGGVVETAASAQNETVSNPPSSQAVGSQQPAIIPTSSESSGNPSITSTFFNPAAIIAPYTNYVLTQGPHGFSYGHMAIDMTAGNGVSILSPINGIVTANYVDEYQNTVLVIENDVYQITMLHGNYSVGVDDEVQQGQIVGSESNNGYTMDMNGNLCYGRNCGYHTHLNIFDKRLGQNVNPIEVLGLR